MAPITAARNGVLVWLLLIFSTVCDGQCPSPNGFFEDPAQCDKYLACVDGQATDKLCPDGLVFTSRSSLYERCDLPHVIAGSCDSRELRQPPQPTEHCPRQNGLYRHENPGNCSHFWSCDKGKATSLKCPDSLVFHEPSGSCEWPDVAQRVDCEPEVLLGFTCPSLYEQSLQPYEHTRYNYVSDCRKFYICVYGRSPRLLQCPEYQVFNWQTLQCDDPNNVIGCETYYSASAADLERHGSHFQGN